MPIIKILLVVAMLLVGQASAKEGNISDYMDALGGVLKTWRVSAEHLDRAEYVGALAALNEPLPEILGPKLEKHRQQAMRIIETLSGRKRQHNLYGLHIRLEAYDRAYPYSKDRRRSDGDRERYLDILILKGELKEAAEWFYLTTPSTAWYYKERLAGLRKLSELKKATPEGLLEQYYIHRCVPPWTVGDRLWQGALPLEQKLFSLLNFFEYRRDSKGKILCVEALVRIEKKLNSKAIFELALEVGNELHRKKLKEEALRMWKNIPNEKELLQCWGKAIYNRGLVLRELGRFKQAIAMQEQILPSAINDKELGESVMSMYRSYRHRACVEIAKCHESLGQFDEALKYIVLALCHKPNHLTVRSSASLSWLESQRCTRISFSRGCVRKKSGKMSLTRCQKKPLRWTLGCCFLPSGQCLSYLLRSCL